MKLVGFFQLKIQNPKYNVYPKSPLHIPPHLKNSFGQKNKLENFAVKFAFHLDQSLRFQDLGPRNKMEYMEPSLKTQNK